MKKSVLFAMVTMAVGKFANAQQPIDELIASEKKFAETSKQQTTKKAFLAFVDSNCVGFSSGEKVNVYKQWVDRKEDSSKLTWAPEFAIISASGEMGVTTGPWEYRAKSLQDPAIAHGHFATVWKKNKKGIWKAMFDMGTGYPQQITNSETVKEFVLPKNNDKKEIASSLVNIELKFRDAFESNKTAAIKKVILPDSWFTINGSAPLKNAAEINAAMDAVPSNTVFKSTGLIASSTNDMFAVYGTAESADKKQNFMRLWVKQNSEWKLLMMVIQ